MQISARDEPRTKENVFMVARNPDTGEVAIRKSHNLVVEKGRKYLADFMAGEDSRDVDFLAVGSSGTATTDGMNALQGTEHIRKQVAASDITHPNVDETQYEVKIASNEPSSQPVDFKEVGLFFASSGGDMFARATHQSFTKTADFEVRYYYTVGYANP